MSALLFQPPAGVAAEPTPLVFTHVTVIDATGWPPLPNRTVIWRTWDPKSGGRAPFPEADEKRWERIREQSMILLKMLQAGGMGLLAGSDSGASNNFSFPGWTLYRELELMVESGLTPMQALQTASCNPACYLGELDRAGTVEAGKSADLVLLKANPLTDIRNIEEIEAVVLRGNLLARADLDKLLDDVAKAAASARTS